MTARIILVEEKLTFAAQVSHTILSVEEEERKENPGNEFKTMV